jgi:4-amino-4-deoxy-L-arabinose transferase-like glycosyltransferase
MDPSRQPPVTRRLIVIVLASLAFAMVAATIPAPGPTWDEPTSLVASEFCVNWLFSPGFSREAIYTAWGPNHEHPPLAKIWIGLVRHAVQFIVPGFPNLVASRLATAMLFAVLVALIYTEGSRLGPAAGISAALFALFMPRLFAHAHFAALDLPMALAWFAAAYAFARGIRNTRWAVAAGVLFGAALLTKINAVFIPLPLILWAVLAHRKKAILPAALLLGIGAVVFFAGWPWLWHDTAARLRVYLFNTTLNRSVIAVYYLGKIYSERYAPWHYPFVLTLFTVPLGILVCLVLGLKQVFKWETEPGDDRPCGITPLFAAINFVAILLVSALRWAPKYDGVRLFLPLFPFVALLAGVGFQRLWERYGRRRSRPVVACVFVALQALGIVLYHPYETSYYNLLCGGLPGAQKLGLETTYWGDVYADPVFEYINNLPEGSRVAFFPAESTFQDIYEWDGYLSDKIAHVNFKEDEFDYAVLMAREGLLLRNERAARLFREGEPLLEVKRLGATLCVIKRSE